MATDFSIHINQAEFSEALRFLKKVEKSLDSKWIQKTLRRNAMPMARKMKAGSHSARLVRMIGVTTSKKYAGKGVRVGVVKNNKKMFPKFSAQALAAILEYGTHERFRRLKKFGIITGRVSTGKMRERPSIRPAWDNGKNAMIKKTVDAIKKKVPQ